MIDQNTSRAVNRSTNTGRHLAIPLSSVSISDAETSAVVRALEEGNVSGTGPDVQILEDQLRHITGRRHAIATNSGTSSLEVALGLLRCEPLDEVIVPALTFAAPASAVVNAGLTPVICDVDPETWTLSAEACHSLMSKRTRAILAVDVMGNPCDFGPLLELGVPVIEDAAEALGGSLEDKPLGSFGAVSVLSFHANKTVSAGEGGAFLTDDDELAAGARLRVNHGMSSGYTHSVAGRNLRMANLVAAFAGAQLARVSQLLDRRSQIISQYEKAFLDLPLHSQRVPVAGQRAPWLGTFRLSNRTDLLAHLRANRIDARAVWPSLSTQPFLISWRRPAPVAERLADECIWLPTHAEMPDEHVHRVIDTVRDFFATTRRKHGT